jgi:hypothetical protein
MNATVSHGAMLFRRFRRQMPHDRGVRKRRAQKKALDSGAGGRGPVKSSGDADGYTAT